MNVADMRRDYRQGAIRDGELAPDPCTQFRTWFREACEAGVIEPNALSLATSWADGRPLVRTVLLKDYDERGFVFYTNLGSRKARQLAENPQAAMLFPWLALERQVAVTGAVERLSAGEVLRYFVTRPRDSQLAAWASQQSSGITTREALESQWEAMKRKFSAGDVPLPDFWGGFRLVPESFEFWQGGSNRLHDRFLYTRDASGQWRHERLAP